MAKMVPMTGNVAVANAMRQINPDVCAAYPITPSTEVMQQFTSFVADGKVDTEMVAAESEHSAMSACIGAAAAGGRVMTATSANGMALMWEMLYIASGSRLPIQLALVNRALSAPINIHCDHSDSYGARDSGWIQLFSENAQEAYDNMIMSVGISEDENVRLPTMVCLDGFIISHAIESMYMLEDKDVQDFVGEYKPLNPLLDVDNPVSYGPIALQDYYMESKRQQHEAMKNAGDVILRVSNSFGDKFGRYYEHVEKYCLDDADFAIVCMGSSAGTAKFVVDQMRKSGMAAGLLKIRTFRPFPKDVVSDALQHVKCVAAMDRADSFNNSGGVLFNEIRSAMYDRDKKPKIINYIYGLGGRDVGVGDFKQVFKRASDIANTGVVGELVSYLGVRE